MKKTITALLIYFAALTPCPAWDGAGRSAPSVLPHVSRPMKTAGFWISRHPHPDTLVLDKPGIQAFNTRLVEAYHLTTDVLAFPDEVPGTDIRAELEEQYTIFIGQEYFFSDGRQAGRPYFETLRKNMNFPALNSIRPVRYGFIVRYTAQRLLPAEDILTAKPGDIDFDEAQNSALNAGTPMIILHESTDGEWFYGRTFDSIGWVKKMAVAVCERPVVRQWEKAGDFAVTLDPKTDIFLDRGMTHYYDYAQMGSRFPLMKKTRRWCKVLLPTRDPEGRLVMSAGYLPAAALSRGYLPFTPRHILKQAFKMLNAPYGWGGMYGEQDCSRFIQEVFSTVGLRLPRNSSEQSAVHPALAEFLETSTEEKKLKVLQDDATGAATLLYLKGHIMLYLGTVDNVPYAIHAPWAYRERSGSRDDNDTAYVINKVVVSDLSLGENSARGSLVSRLKSIVDLSQRGAEGPRP